ncbi:MAG TPA: hypothetical protein VMT46_06380 [Anaerolineaceae bacterium]|nr:hypothetical protein [Anaerolineaceae bacterium]
MSRKYFCLLLGSLVLAACLPPGPTLTAAPSEAASFPKTGSVAPSETPQPNPTSTTEPPTETPQPNPPAAEPTRSSPPPGWEEFIFTQYGELAVWYDPAAWMPDKAPGQGRLTSVAMANCLITDSWPTQPPLFDPSSFTLGWLEFQVAQAEQNGQRVLWYKLLSGPANNPYPTQGVAPVFVIAAPLPQPEPCIQAAQASLITLHLAPQ